MKLGTLIGMTMVLAMVMVGGQAHASKEGKGHGFHGAMMKELNLTPEQKEKLKAIRSQNKGDRKENRQEMKKLREELETAMRGSASDSELKSKFEAIQKKQQEFAKERFEHVLAIRAILTPEQRAKFKGMGPGMGHGGMGPGMGGKHGHGSMGDADSEDDGE